MGNCIKCKAELPEGAKFCPACGKKQEASPRKHHKRANGTGSISKLPGQRKKPWLARKNNVCIGTYATYWEAQKALERLADANVTDKFNMTFQQVYEAWRPVHAREVGTSQMGCYSSAYKNASKLHDKPFRSLRKSDFQAVILNLEEAEKSKSSCEKVLQLFGQLSAWAVDEGIVQANHAQNVTTVAKQKSTRASFAFEDIEAMKRSQLPAAQIALILIGTGCRPGELFSVPLANCASNYFIGGSKTEAGRNRVIAVSPIGLEAYRQLLERAKEAGQGRLIDGYSGNRDCANFAKRDFKALMEEIGCQGMTPYNCRHTFSTLAVKSGVSPQILRRQMGHADIKTADKYYTHLDAEDILAGISGIRLDRVTDLLQTESKPQKSKKLQVAINR